MSGTVEGVRFIIFFLCQFLESSLGEYWSLGYESFVEYSEGRLKMATSSF